MIFVVLTAMTLLGGLAFSGKEKTYRKIYIFLMTCAFIFFAGFRSYRIGTDTPGYALAFINAPKLTVEQIKIFLSKREFLFQFMQSFVRGITGSYSVWFFLIATFYIVCVGKFINRYSKMPAISFLLFMSMGYFSFSLAGLRQTIAMGFLLIATRWLLEKKTFKFFLWVGIASLFHITAWVYVLAYVIYRLPLNKMFVIACVFLTGLFYLFGETLLQGVVELIWGDSRDYKESEYGGISTFLVLIFVSVATMIFYSSLFKPTEKGLPLNAEKEYNSLFFKMLLLSCAFQVMAIYQANVFRVAMIFHFPLICLLPNVLDKQKDLNSKSTAIVVVCAVLLFQLFAITYFSADIIPYTFFWQV